MVQDTCKSKGMPTWEALPDKNKGAQRGCQSCGPGGKPSLARCAVRCDGRHAGKCSSCILTDLLTEKTTGTSITRGCMQSRSSVIEHGFVLFTSHDTCMLSALGELLVLELTVLIALLHAQAGHTRSETPSQRCITPCSPSTRGSSPSHHLRSRGSL